MCVFLENKNTCNTTVAGIERVTKVTATNYRYRQVNACQIIQVKTHEEKTGRVTKGEDVLSESSTRISSTVNHNMILLREEYILKISC